MPDLFCFYTFANKKSRAAGGGKAATEKGVTADAP